MKKGTTRQILYRPEQKTTVLKEKEKPRVGEKVTPIVRVEYSIEEKSKRLYKWLREHKLINVNGLCIIVDVDRANFLKGAKKDKPLKEEVFDKFFKELSNYGFSV